jgi:hypothetical protein
VGGINLAKVTTIRLEDDQIALLKTIAVLEGRTVSEEIREAVNLLVASKRADKDFLERKRQQLELLDALS